MADVETVQERYDRDWLNLKDDRKVRGFDYMSPERRSREYVDPAEFEVDDDGKVKGSAAKRFDNTPDDFNRSEFEETLPYNPNA